jgi:Uncharacterized protein conserved in bacteria (DUF2330)
LFQWLTDNGYHYAGDEETLNHYVKKKWYFTVMRIDTMQMKKKNDGTFSGEVTATRFQFTSEKLVYPLKITQISVKDSTEALFYVQAPYKVDLRGDLTYQHTWVPMLQAAKGSLPGGIPGGGEDWLSAIAAQAPDLLKRGRDLGYTFQSGVRPGPNAQGRTPTTIEWAKRLTASDIAVLQGKSPFTEQVPGVDFGFTRADILDKRRGPAIAALIQARIDQINKQNPNGFLVREAPKEQIRQLNLLLGHLQRGKFITKFRKMFTRGEMNDDLELVAARLAMRKTIRITRFLCQARLRNANPGPYCVLFASFASLR